jgi:hypothetical protein
MTEPQHLVPQELMRVVAKECKMAASRMFMELKMENVELTNIGNSMVEWIFKNTRGTLLQGSASGG